MIYFIIANYKILSFQYVINKILMTYFTFFHTKSPKFDVHFIITVYLSSDQLHFKCSTATCGERKADISYPGLTFPSVTWVCLQQLSSKTLWYLTRDAKEFLTQGVKHKAKLTTFIFTKVYTAMQNTGCFLSSHISYSFALNEIN